MMTDPIADMLTRIRNAQITRHATVVIPASKTKRRIAEILVEAGYLTSVQDAKTDGGHDAFQLELKYLDGEPVLQKLSRESTPGRRQYVKASEIPEVRNGLGLAILSTSHGVLSGATARDKNVGGEVLATFY